MAGWTGRSAPSSFTWIGRKQLSDAYKAKDYGDFSDAHLVYEQAMSIVRLIEINEKVQVVVSAVEKHLAGEEQKRQLAEEQRLAIYRRWRQALGKAIVLLGVGYGAWQVWANWAYVEGRIWAVAEAFMQSSEVELPNDGHPEEPQVSPRPVVLVNLFERDSAVVRADSTFLARVKLTNESQSHLPPFRVQVKATSQDIGAQQAIARSPMRYIVPSAVIGEQEISGLPPGASKQFDILCRAGRSGVYHLHLRFDNVVPRWDGYDFEEEPKPLRLTVNR